MNTTLIIEAVMLAILPFFAGLLFLLKEALLQSKRNSLYPFLLGLMLFLFIDSFRDSASLGGDSRVSEGLLIFVPFLFFMLVLPALSEFMKSAESLASLLILALALHTAGEVAEIYVSLQAIPESQLIMNYIPGFIAFAGHKFIEGFVASFLLSEVRLSSRAKITVPVLTIIFVSLAGALASALAIFSSVYFFAAGTAGDIFIIAFLFEKGRTKFGILTFGPYIYIVAGFTLIYLLGYLHSIA